MDDDSLRMAWPISSSASLDPDGLKTVAAVAWPVQPLRRKLSYIGKGVNAGHEGAGGTVQTRVPDGRSQTQVQHEGSLLDDVWADLQLGQPLCIDLNRRKPAQGFARPSVHQVGNPIELVQAVN